MFIGMQLILLCARILREITDRKVFEINWKRKENLQKFKNLLDTHLPTYIAVIDSSLKFKFQNSLFKSLFSACAGEQFNEYNKISCLSCLSLRDIDSMLEMFKTATFDKAEIARIDKFLEILIRNDVIKEVLSFQAIHNLEDNRIFEIKIFPIIWEDAKGYTIIMNDITSQEMILSMKIADANKDKVIATVSHELKTPINAMLGIIEIVISPEVKKYCVLCKNNAKLLLHIVNSIPDLQLVRKQKLHLNPEKFSLKEKVEEIRDLFEYLCKEKGLYLNLELSPNLPEEIYTDKNRLTQILINLVGNAVKFTFHGGITLSAHRVDDPTGEIIISIKDTGIGIKNEEKDRLFKMFGKLEDENRVNTQGVGLGLTISNSLAIYLNNDIVNKRGQIEVDSEFGKGSTFTFRISSKLEQLIDPLSYIIGEKDIKIQMYNQLLFRNLVLILQLALLKKRPLTLQKYC